MLECSVNDLPEQDVMTVIYTNYGFLKPEHESCLDIDNYDLHVSPAEAVMLFVPDNKRRLGTSEDYVAYEAPSHIETRPQDPCMIANVIEDFLHMML